MRRLAVNYRILAQTAFLFGMCLWQALPAVLGGMLFVLLVRIFWMGQKNLAGIGTAFAVMGLVIICFNLPHQSLGQYFVQGFTYNMRYLNLLLHGHFLDGLSDYLNLTAARNYLVTTIFPVVAIFTFMELIPGGAHAVQVQSKPQQASKPLETRSQRIQQSLEQLLDQDYDGTLLGLPANSNRPRVMPDAHVNQLALVLGTTGGGKTITLRRFYRRALTANYPLIIVDGKPTAENTAWIAREAQEAGKPFYGFNCENHWHYDPLSQGGYTELKDKIISLKDEWESDYYRSIAEDYLQTAFEILLASGEPYSMERVVECLDFGELAGLVRTMDNPRLEVRAKRISGYDRKDITGLQAHLNILIHSELGEYFKRKEGHTFDLNKVIEDNAVVYFALPALRFPSFSSVLGKLIINDIKAVIDREHSGKRVFTVFDEFSVFAGDQVLNLVNMGRGKGIHAIFGTQGLSDLKRVDGAFANQILNCVNTIICHRLNDHDSAESIAAWAGTRDSFSITTQISAGGSTGTGTVSHNKSFIIHPDAIKQSLQTGEAFYISKVGQFCAEQIRVKYS